MLDMKAAVPYPRHLFEAVADVEGKALVEQGGGTAQAFYVIAGREEPVDLVLRRTEGSCAGLA